MDSLVHDEDEVHDDDDDVHSEDEVHDDDDDVAEGSGGETEPRE